MITLGVLSLVGLVWGVLRLNGRVDNLEVARLDIDDIRTLRKELEDDILIFIEKWLERKMEILEI